MKPDLSFYRQLSYISSLFILGPLLSGIFSWRKLNKAQKWVFYFIIASAISEILLYYLSKYRINNLFIARFQTIAEMVLLSFFFIDTFQSSRRKVLIKSLIVFFFMVAIFDLFLNGFNSTDNISMAVVSILLMVYSILGYFHLVNNPVYENILAAPLFWFSTAILTYFSGTMFLFLFSNYIERHHAGLSPVLWAINSLLNMVLYILISIGFWKTAKQI